MKKGVKSSGTFIADNHYFLNSVVCICIVCICRAASEGCLLMIGIYVAPACTTYIALVEH